LKREDKKDLREKLLALDGALQAKHGNVFLAGRLLRFDETSGTIKTHKQVACDFRIEGARMARFLDFQNTLDPGHDFM
jgi:hypothetical protein